MGLHPDGAIQGACLLPLPGGASFLYFWGVCVCDLGTPELASVQMSPRWPGNRGGLTERSCVMLFDFWFLHLLSWLMHLF